MILKKFTIGITIFISQFTYGGAWGVGSFENDRALDWAYELTSTNSASVLFSTLHSLPSNGYIGQDYCTAAMAAAEVVASLKSGHTTALPQEVAEWTKKHRGLFDANLTKAAIDAVTVCQDTQRSELAGLWLDASPKEWEAYLIVLRIKLK